MVKLASNQKTALVTGSTSGIGFGIAQALLEQGYFVFLNGRDSKKGEAVLTSLQSKFGQLELIIADVSLASGVETLVQHIESKGVQLDVLVTNVGSGRCSNELSVEQAEYQRAMDVNFFSAVNVCQGLAKWIKSPGAIVCISSIAGVAPIGAPIPYACAKAALNMFVKEWAKRLADKHIRVNSISPGNVMFPGSVWDRKMQEDTEKTEAYIAQNVPLNAFVTPEDIAEMVCLVATSKAMTGQNIVIDGGQLGL